MALTLQLIICILVLNHVQVSHTQKCTETHYEETTHNKKETRITSMMPGDYIIQGLMTFTHIDDSGGVKCGKVSASGVLKTMAFKYAIERINNRTDIMPKGTLGYQLDNVCRSLPVTMARGIEVVSLHRPNSVCRASFLKCDKSKNVTTVQVKPATAVIGTGMSFTTIPLASLLSLYYIPQVSYAASSRLLSKKDLYKSFFRTIPSDTNQIVVMLDIITKFKWNYVFAVGSDDDYGKLGISELKQQSLGRGVCISHDEYIPYQSIRTPEKVKAIVKKIKDEHKAKVVVLFCYALKMGELILEEANRQGVKRVWLTSEAWFPRATQSTLNISTQLEGLLSVSLKMESLPKFQQYVRDSLQKNVSCDVWLANYIRNTYQCQVKQNQNGLLIGTNETGGSCQLNISIATNELLSKMDSNLDKLIDAVNSVAHGIKGYLRDINCTHTACTLPKKLVPLNLTNQIFKVNFLNDHNETVSFDKKGDPEHAYYMIKNIQNHNGTLKWVDVGHWDGKKPNRTELQLQEERITWPTWVDGVPESVCSKQCQPGQKVVGKTGCCWGCDDCPANHVSGENMSYNCTQCPSHMHTIDKKVCVLTPVNYLKANEPAGMSILVLSVVGIVFIIVAAIILHRLRQTVIVAESKPNLLIISLVILVVTFLYGPLHVFRPTDVLCQTMNAYFFIILMLFAALLLVKTNFMTELLQNNVVKSTKGNLFAAQSLFLLLVLIIEIIAIAVWLYLNPVKVEDFKLPDKYEKYKQCEVVFTPPRLVATFIPCVILIIATFCAFRERNIEHAFYEPKFLSFTCIALCIIIVAFLPTFKYVIGIFKPMVMAFTIDVCGFTYMSCLILPKLYISIVYHRNDNAQSPNGHVPETMRQQTNPGMGCLEATSQNHKSESISEISSVSDVKGKTGSIDDGGVYIGEKTFQDDGGVYCGPDPEEMNNRNAEKNGVVASHTNLVCELSKEPSEDVNGNENTYQTEL